MKKIVALFIVATLFICGNTTVFAAPQPQAELYSYYSNDMLFKQNDDAVFAGTAAAGTKINCTLYNSADTEIASAEAIASSDGTFSVYFTSPSGSFEEYTIILTADGTVFETLTGVVFGELWLAGGQSNMQMSLMGSKTGYEMAVNNERGSDALRFFYIPYMGGNYNGDPTYMPATPLTDYTDTVGWYKGSDVKVFELSAVAYYFAENLIKELNMPVGILNANLGGTSILTWLSRETIENDVQLLADCKSDNRYIPLNKWNEKNTNFSIDMTCCFNKIMAPLKNFRLSGMLWYQGESDISWEYGRYSRAFNALQKSYTEYFNFKNGLLPIVFTQLASYSYGDLTVLQNKNIEFSEIQQQKPDSRALTTILDIPLDYTIDTHAIHPLCKEEVGNKMAYAAMGLVYDKYDTYTAATVKSTQINDNSIYVTFRDFGDKLSCDGDKLNAFSICDSDGIYLPAKAEIVSADTIKVYSSAVTEPVSVAYAYSQTNINANLFASENGKKTLAVSPFVTDLSVGTHYWHNEAWASCDYDTFWHCHTNEYSGFYITWKSINSAHSIESSSHDTGNALRVTNTSKEFSVQPNFTYTENGKEKYFMDIDRDWSDYTALSFDVKVHSENAVKFNGLKLIINGALWVMPAVSATNKADCTIEADGKMHTVTLDLNKLLSYGNANLIKYKADKLTDIRSVEFIFTDTGDGNADISIDNISFTADNTDNENNNKMSFFDKIKAFFASLLEKLADFFNISC